MRRRDAVALILCVGALLGAVGLFSFFRGRKRDLLAQMQARTKTIADVRAEVKSILALRAERRRDFQPVDPSGVASFIDSEARSYRVDLTRIEPGTPVVEKGVRRYTYSLRLSKVEFRPLTAFLYEVVQKKPQLRISALRLFSTKDSPNRWDGLVEISFVEPVER